jgi:putative phosphoesterase
MKRIGLLSDTHSYLDPKIFEHFEECDEIWHAGDFGTVEIYDKLNIFRPTKGVFGNIDGKEIRLCCPRDLIFRCEDHNIYMTHIGGYPGKYETHARIKIFENKPDIFICGHSHILKIMPDKQLNLLHINPGAAGNYGFHQVRTIVRFTLEPGKISDMQVIELGGKFIIPEHL